MTRPSPAPPLPPDRAAPLAAALLRALPVVRRDAECPVGRARAWIRHVAQLRAVVDRAALAGNLRAAGEHTATLARACGATEWVRSGGHLFDAGSFASAVCALGRSAEASAAATISPQLATLAQRAHAMAAGHLLEGAITVDIPVSAIERNVISDLPEEPTPTAWAVALGAHACHWADAFATLALVRHAEPFTLTPGHPKAARLSAKQQLAPATRRTLRAQARRAFRSAWTDALTNARARHQVLVPKRLARVPIAPALTPQAQELTHHA